MAKFFSRLAKAAPTIALDAVGLGGAASISYGCYLAWPPSGFIAGGTLVIIGCWLVARSN